MLLARQLVCGFVSVRKPGKLPGVVDAQDYALEYGIAALCLSHGAIKQGKRVVIADDLLATGGTAAAAAQLVQKQGGVVVGFAFVVELTDLDGRQRLRYDFGGAIIHSLLVY